MEITNGRRLFFSFGAELFGRGIRRRFTARESGAIALLPLGALGADAPPSGCK